MTPAVFAPAKINLFLHVGPPRPDGFHPISSLMVFADIGDRLSLEPAAAFGLEVGGAHAAGAPADERNLVVRAARALFAHAGVDLPALRIQLEKALPVAAGLGGGSSDAAATLRLLRDHLRLDVSDATLERIGADIGSDVPACIRARAVIGEGRGERLAAAPGLPALHAVLLDPGAPSSTPEVYRAYDAAGASGTAETPPLPASFVSIEALVAALAATRNDLEAPAIALQPKIGAALQTLRAAPEALFARMSGSGSACFALCADEQGAQALASRLPGAKSCRLA